MEDVFWDMVFDIYIYIYTVFGPWVVGDVPTLSWMLSAAVLHGTCSSYLMVSLMVPDHFSGICLSLSVCIWGTLSLNKMSGLLEFRQQPSSDAGSSCRSEVQEGGSWPRGSDRTPAAAEGWPWFLFSVFFWSNKAAKFSGSPKHMFCQAEKISTSKSSKAVFGRFIITGL